VLTLFENIPVNGSVVLNRSSIIVTNNATFIVSGNVTIQVGSTLDLTNAGTTYISGSLILESGATIAVGVSEQFTPITIEGCASLNGNLSVNVTKNISATTTQQKLFNTTCHDGNFSNVNILFGSNVNQNCLSSSNYDASSLSLVFTFNPQCGPSGPPGPGGPGGPGSNTPSGQPSDLLSDPKIGPIIGGAVGAAILALIIILFILSLSVESMRRKIYPHQFAQRFESKTLQRHRSSMHLKTRGSQTELDLAEPAAQPVQHRDSVHRTRSQSRLDANVITAQAAAEAKFMDRVARGSNSGTSAAAPVELEASQASASGVSEASVNAEDTV